MKNDGSIDITGDPKAHEYAASAKQKFSDKSPKLFLGADRFPKAHRSSCASSESMLNIHGTEPHFLRIDNLALEILEMQSLLEDVVKPIIRLEIECAQCAVQLNLTAHTLFCILLKLILNALDAFESHDKAAGQQFIRIRAERGGKGTVHCLPLESSPNGTVVITVRDNGPGIHPAIIERIFEPGFSTRRGDVAEYERVLEDRGLMSQHHGMGLCIARELVEQAGGAMRVVSSVKAGTRFDIVFPIAG